VILIKYFKVKWNVISPASMVWFYNVKNKQATFCIDGNVLDYLIIYLRITFT